MQTALSLISTFYLSRPAEKKQRLNATNISTQRLKQEPSPCLHLQYSVLLGKRKRNVKTHGGIASNTYICVELPHKAGEISVFEVTWKQSLGERGRIRHHKAIVRRAPRDHSISVRVINHVISLVEERRRPDFAQALHRPGNLHRRVLKARQARLHLQVLLLHYIEH